MEKGLFSWLREQFVPSGEPSGPSKPTEDEYLSRRQLIARLGRDPYPEWFAGFPEHLWPDRVMFWRTRVVERRCKAFVESRAELEEKRKAVEEARAEMERHVEGIQEREVSEERAEELKWELRRAELYLELAEKRVRREEGSRDLWVELAIMQKAPEELTRGEVAAHLGRDRYPEWFAGFPEHVWPDRVSLEHIVSIEEECGNVAEAQAGVERHPVGSEDRDLAKDSLRDAEGSRDLFAASPIECQMYEERDRSPADRSPRGTRNRNTASPSASRRRSTPPRTPGEPEPKQGNREVRAHDTGGSFRCGGLMRRRVFEVQDRRAPRSRERACCRPWWRIGGAPHAT
jgi:hypothetical protein